MLNILDRLAAYQERPARFNIHLGILKRKR